VDLTPAEFDLLAALARAPGRAFSRADLVEARPYESKDDRGPPLVPLAP
jgi:DNA-binding response OmpR family regulator